MLNPLVNTIHLKKKNGGTYILLLGAGCSIYSNCPSAKKLIGQLINKNKLKLDPENTTFEELEERLGRGDINLNLMEYFSYSNPSKGYWFLAQLVKKGYFDLILTTNFDSCLEKVLAKTMDFDDFKIITRGDVSDERIDELIRLPSPRVKIVKLHGDYLSRNMIVKPDELWELKLPLKETLLNLIKDRGIIMIGYSMHDSSILRILPKDEKQNYWYIDIKSPMEDPITYANLRHTNINKNHIIHGEEGNFDEFFCLLSKNLGELDKEKNEKLKVYFNNMTEKLIDSCKIKIDRITLEHKISLLLQMIKRSGINNLVAIHDPDASGGTEVLRIIEKTFPDWIQNKNIFILQVEGRGINLLTRKVTNFFDSSGTDVTEIDENDQRFLLIDSISFTGGTLEICRDYLIKKFSEDIEVRAAIIYCGRELEKKLKNRNYKFYNLIDKVEVTDNYHILFPWGWTFSTKPIYSNDKLMNSEDYANEFIYYRYFTFLPRPWGNVLSLMENKQISVKILEINPREMTSKHKHFARNEIFLVLGEHLIIQVWDEYFHLHRGSSFRVPASTEHRLIGLDVPCRVLEISEEYYNQIEDIVRTDDKYNRKNKKGDV